MLKSVGERGGEMNVYRSFKGADPYIEKSLRSFGAKNVEAVVEYQEISYAVNKAFLTEF